MDATILIKLCIEIGMLQIIWEIIGLFAFEKESAPIQMQINQLFPKLFGK